MKIYLSLILILLGAYAGFGQHQRFHGKPQFRPFTQRLPPVDKVELLKLEVDGDLWHGKIADARTLQGVRAKRIAALWRSQIYLPLTSACHNPVYAIKFYSGKKLLAYASICWDCRNIALLTPEIHDTQYFDATGRKGQRLLKVFQDLFGA